MIYIAIIIITTITIFLLGLGFGYFIAYNRDRNYQKLEEQYDALKHIHERDIKKHFETEKELKMVITDTFTNRSVKDLEKVIEIIKSIKNRKEE